MADYNGAELEQEMFGSAGNLVLDLITASMDSNFKTMDTLYEVERERRQALEVLIEDVLEAAEYAWGGTAREYEKVLDILRRRHGLNDTELAKHHPENHHH